MVLLLQAIGRDSYFTYPNMFSRKTGVWEVLIWFVDLEDGRIRILLTGCYCPRSRMDILFALMFLSLFGHQEVQILNRPTSALFLLTIQCEHDLDRQQWQWRRCSKQLRSLFFLSFLFSFFFIIFVFCFKLRKGKWVFYDWREGQKMSSLPMVWLQFWYQIDMDSND